MERLEIDPGLEPSVPEPEPTSEELDRAMDPNTDHASAPNPKVKKPKAKAKAKKLTCTKTSCKTTKEVKHMAKKPTKVKESAGKQAISINKDAMPLVRRIQADLMKQTGDATSLGDAVEYAVRSVVKK
jgi:hypothetical protein